MNVVGTANVLVASADDRCPQGRAHVVERGVRHPERKPGDRGDACRPLEAYGRAKLEAEVRCHEAVSRGLDVTIIRPRTILGHGRLGIMAILFEFVADGAPVSVSITETTGTSSFTLPTSPGRVPAPGEGQVDVYNIGATEFGTMRSNAQALVDPAGNGSQVRPASRGPGGGGDDASPPLGLVPFAPYHWLLYGESLWFDVTGHAPSWMGAGVPMRR